MKIMIAMFVAAMLLMGSAFALLWSYQVNAHSKAVVFDTYTHAILCDSLIIDLTELKKAKEQGIETTVKLMIKYDCPGTTLP